MKKLSQTWKQTRPRKESCRKRQLLEKNGEKPCEVLSNNCGENWRKCDGGERENIPLPNKKRDIWVIFSQFFQYVCSLVSSSD